jgi:large subunit ribosomal protein L29
MDYTELNNMPEKELRELLAEKRHELRELRFQASERQLKQLHKLNDAKKTIARIETVLSARAERRS